MHFCRVQYSPLPQIHFRALNELVSAVLVQTSIDCAFHLQTIVMTVIVIMEEISIVSELGKAACTCFNSLRQPYLEKDRKTSHGAACRTLPRIYKYNISFSLLSIFDESVITSKTVLRIAAHCKFVYTDERIDN